MPYWQYVAVCLGNWAINGWLRSIPLGFSIKKYLGLSSWIISMALKTKAKPTKARLETGRPFFQCLEIVQTLNVVHGGEAHITSGRHDLSSMDISKSSISKHRPGFISGLLSMVRASHP
jgi:hypothetical protein